MFPQFTLPQSLAHYAFGHGGREGIDALSGENYGFRPLRRPLDEQSAHEYIEAFLKGGTVDTDSLQASMSDLKAQLADVNAMSSIMKRHRRRFYELRNERECSALELAVISLDAPVIDQMLSAENADLHGSDAGAALAIAVEIEALAIVSVFSRLGAGINAQDGEGRTALHKAARIGTANVITSLLNNPNCDAKIQDMNGETPLMDAAQLGSADCVKLLIPRSDLFATNSNGCSAEALALTESPETAGLIKAAALAAMERSILHECAHTTSVRKAATSTL